ncbi:MAG: AI-2E family transporter [Chloroflexi bacterium]|nr:AI-2E family transporter [Chloroflexota bacterium]
MNERIPGARLLTPLLVVVLVLLTLRLLPLPLEKVFVTIFTAILLAAAVSPAADALEKYHIPRGVTVLTLYLVGLLALTGVVALIVPLVSSEVTSLQDRLPRYNEDLRRLIERIAPEQADRFASDAIANEFFDQLGGQLGRATGYAVTLSSLVLRIIIVLVMSYFMAVEAGFAERVVTRFTPPAHRARVHRIMSNVGNRLGHWARAQLLLALYFGLLFGVGLRLAGVPYAVTLGVVGGVIEIIPYIGGFITLILAVLIAATKAPLLVVWVVVWYTFVVQTQAHVFAPVLMGRVVGMHPLVVVISLFVGVEALGFYGALLAVPIAVVLQALLDEFYFFSPLDASSGDAVASSAGPPEGAAPADQSSRSDPQAEAYTVSAND